MSAILQLDTKPIARRSLSTLLEITDHVNGAAGIWRSKEPMRRELARTVKRMFDLLAWSDGQVDDQEIGLLQALVETDPEFGSELADQVTFDPADPLHPRVPPLLEATIAYDRRTGSSLSSLVIDELETLGYSIVAIDGNPIDVERQELRTYIESLRLWASMLAA